MHTIVCIGIFLPAPLDNKLFTKGNPDVIGFVSNSKASHLATSVNFKDILEVLMNRHVEDFEVSNLQDGIFKVLPYLLILDLLNVEPSFFDPLDRCCHGLFCLLQQFINIIISFFTIFFK